MMIGSKENVQFLSGMAQGSLPHLCSFSCREEEVAFRKHPITLLA